MVQFIYVWNFPPFQLVPNTKLQMNYEASGRNQTIYKNILTQAQHIAAGTNRL